MSGQTYTLQALLSGVYTTIPLYATPITVERGRAPFADWPGRSFFTCEVADDLLQYDPSRPASVLYGVAGRNTPVRIRPNGSNYLYGEASWRPARTPDHVPGAARGRSGVTVTADGVLTRIGQWEDPLRSPMYRTISGRSTSIGHWSIEDGRDSTRLDNSLASGVGGVAQNGVQLGDSEVPLGAGSSAKIVDGSRMAGTFVTASTTAGWQVSWSFRASQLPASGAGSFEFFRIVAANGYKYVFLCSNTGFWMHVEDSDGTALADPVYNFGAGASPDANWLTMRLAVQQVGGNVSWNWAWYAQELDVFYVPTGSFAGSISRPTFWEQNGNATTAGWWFTQVFGVTGLTDDLMSATNRAVFNGYKGETSRARYFRLLAENGITGYGIGNTADTALMGAQRPNTLIQLLKECRNTDDAEIVDERFDIALTFYGRRAMYVSRATPALTLARTDLADYEKIIGADGVANRVVVRNADGGEATAVLETGPMSVLPPPTGIGEYKKQIDVSVDDTDVQLSNLANWHLAKGTVEGARYTSVTVDLVASPSLLTAAKAVREGDFVALTGLEPDTVTALVVGIKMEQTSGTHRISFLLEPGDVYNVGIWDDASFRWDAKYSTLSGAHTSTATALTLSAARRSSVWSTAFTGDLMIAGERVTVTTMGAATGSGPFTQTATVVRSVNGVVKALPANSSVHLADGKRWGL